MRFVDRQDAGRKLAARLEHFRNESPIVLGLPRGGVPVAFEVAQALDAELDVWIVRKVGAPDYPELALGAVAEGDIVYLNKQLIDEVGATSRQIDQIVKAKQAEVAMRVKLFRSRQRSIDLVGKTVILIDDGIATGATVRAAIWSLRHCDPRKIVLAVPVAASQALEELGPLVDEVVCLYDTTDFHAVGAWYDDFQQTTDDEVVSLLEASRAEMRMRRYEVAIPIDAGELSGTLVIPEAPKGLVLFAHGSGSSRKSPRNRLVASTINQYGLATLLFDLLTSEEEAFDQETGESRFDIDLLACRLINATDWVMKSAQTRGLPIGYFGASTGAAAALKAAALRTEVVRAVVSRGGRPDLAMDSLPLVTAPTLLIVGQEDREVLRMNQQAAAKLSAPKELVVIPGATHLFEEPGAMEQVARAAGQWFRQHLAPVPQKSEIVVRRDDVSLQKTDDLDFTNA